MRDICGIYMITNDINNKVYIGQSININKRIQEHFWKSTCQKDISYNSALHNAIRKYGREHFYWEILEECDPSILDEREKIYISQYNSISPNGYNILSGGQQHRTEQTRCVDCGRIIHKYATRCKECDAKHQRHTIWPSRNELKQLIRTTSFEAIGRQFSVDGNAVRKWCDKYNLPRRKTDIKQYTNEEWAQI